MARRFAQAYMGEHGPTVGFYSSDRHGPESYRTARTLADAERDAAEYNAEQERMAELRRLKHSEAVQAVKDAEEFRKNFGAATPYSYPWFVTRFNMNAENARGWKWDIYEEIVKATLAKKPRKRKS